MLSSKLKQSAITLYFYIGYLLLAIRETVGIIATINYNYLQDSKLIQFWFDISYYLHIIYIPILNSVVSIYPAQLSDPRIISPTVFNLIYVALTVVLVLALDNLRRILLNLVSKKIKLDKIVTNLKNMNIYFVTMLVITFVTEIYQSVMAEGLNYNSIYSVVTGLNYSSLFLIVLILLIIGGLNRQISLEKDVKSII